MLDDIREQLVDPEADLERHESAESEQIGDQIGGSRGKVDIDVPIEIQRNQPLMPSVFAKDDRVDDFTPEALSRLLASEPETMSVTPAVGRLAGMSLYELKDELVRRASAGDMAGCDAVMEAAASRFDPETYRSMLMDYQRVLSGLGEAKLIAAPRLLEMTYQRPPHF